MPGGRERVIIQELGPLLSAATADGSSLQDWPSGDFLLQALLPKYADVLPSVDPTFWQKCARQALLKECGFWKDDNGDDDSAKIQQAWAKLTEQAAANDSTATTHNNNKESPDDDDINKNDLVEFFRAGGKSNHRNLQWALMDCAPGCQFHLHAHPNLELVYCVKGELHEIRLDNDDNVLTKSFEPTSPSSSNNDDKTATTTMTNGNIKVKGPSLMGCQRPWHFGTLYQGRWLVNRVGTIHKSFTATNGEGCVLLTLWGGSHANIVEEPTLVLNAVDTMDQKLMTQCAGCHPTAEELAKIAETFLPDSEKSYYRA